MVVSLLVMTDLAGLASNLRSCKFLCLYLYLYIHTYVYIKISFLQWNRISKEALRILTHGSRGKASVKAPPVQG